MSGKVAVVGAGTMGNGIAHVFAQYGWEVLMIDVSPEALAGGPIGRLRDGDLVQIVVDRVGLEGSIDLVGADGRMFGAPEGSRVLAARPPRADLAPDAKLPEDTRLWAALQQAGGGAWGGCVYDVTAIIRRLSAPEALAPGERGRGEGDPTTG